MRTCMRTCMHIHIHAYTLNPRGECMNERMRVYARTACAYEQTSKGIRLSHSLTYLHTSIHEANSSRCECNGTMTSTAVTPCMYMCMYSAGGVRMHICPCLRIVPVPVPGACACAWCLLPPVPCACAWGLCIPVHAGACRFVPRTLAHACACR